MSGTPDEAVDHVAVLIGDGIVVEDLVGSLPVPQVVQHGAHDSENGRQGDQIAECLPIVFIGATE